MKASPARSLRPLLGIFLATLLSVPAQGALASPAQHRGLPDGTALWSEASATVTRARTLAESGTLTGAVRAAVGDTVYPSLPTVPAGDALDGVPAPIAGAIGHLLAAVKVAQPMAEASLTDATAAGRFMELLPSALSADGRTDLRIKAARLEVLAERAVDRDAQAAGALVLAEAIDETLPVLSSFAASVPISSERVVGCDVVDKPPLLCVGGQGANRYEDDYALTIDPFGSDDVYANSAGGANPELNGLDVSVVIDVAGADLYDSPLPVDEEWAVVQGAGRQGGMGMLIDNSGDDTYRAVGDTPGINAQGIGAAGVGVLADFVGNDTYIVRGTAPGTTTTYAHGMGIVGVGVAVDHGVGGFLNNPAAGDVRRVEATPTLQADVDDPYDHHGLRGLRIGPANLGAYGFGVAGSGLFYDDFGNETIAFRAATAPVAPNEPTPIITGCPAPPPEGPRFSWGCSGAWSSTFAIGTGAGMFGGVGLAITGKGDTTWIAESEIEAPAALWAATRALGYSVAGNGALYDGGGNDHYILRAAMNRQDRPALDSGCGCVIPPDAGSGVGWVSDGSSYVQGQGFGNLGSGILHDVGGNDRYEAIVESVAHAESDRGRSAVATAAPAEAWAQGVGFFDGAGYLHDDLGDDQYTVRTTSSAEATETGSGGTGKAESNTAAAWAQGSTFIFAESSQDTGYAEIVDVGGSDAYRVENISSATASPATIQLPGTAASHVQGAVWGHKYAVAVFRDTDGIGTDTFSVVPAAPACTGTRGGPYWVDCGNGVGWGVNL